MFLAEQNEPRREALFLDAKECRRRYGFSSKHWHRLVDRGEAPLPMNSHATNVSRLLARAEHDELAPDVIDAEYVERLVEQQHLEWKAEQAREPAN